MAESEATGIKMGAYDNKGAPVHIWSDTGKEQTEPEFTAAMDVYNKTGKAPKGYVVLPATVDSKTGEFVPSGVVATMRQGYENVNRPLQRGAQAVADIPEPGAALAQRGVKLVGGSMGNPNPLMIPANLLNILRNVAVPAAEQVSTPSKAMTAIGATAAGVATGGASWLPQLIGTGIGAGVGKLAGDIGMSGKADLGQAGIEALLYAGAQGVTGALKGTIGRAVGQRAHQQVAEGMADLFKSKYRNLTYDPNRLEVLAGTKEGLSDLIQVPAKVIMGEVDTVARSLKQSLLQSTALPQGSISSATRRSLNAHIDQLAKASQDMIDATVKGGDISTAKSRYNTLANQMVELISKDTSKFMKQADKEAVINAALQSYAGVVQRFEQGAAVLGLMREAGAGAGFDVRRFQQLIKERLLVGAAAPGSVMRDAASIAGRGNVGGVDSKMHFGDYLVSKINMPPWISQFLSKATPSVGTRYTGTVRGTMPTATATANIATRDGIRSWQDESKRPTIVIEK